MDLSDLDDLIGPVLMIGGAIAFAALIFYVIRTSHRKKLAPLAATFGGEFRTSFFHGYYVSFMNQHVEAKIRLIPASKNTPAYLKLEQQGTLGFDLKITEEGITSRALEKIGLARDVKTGDPAFDEKYAIRASNEAHAMTLLADPASKEAVEHFNRHGFTELDYKKQVLTATKARYGEDDLDPELIREHLAKMMTLVAQA